VFNLKKWKRAARSKATGVLSTPPPDLQLGKRKGNLVAGVHELKGSKNKKLRGACMDKQMAEAGSQPRQSP
jgi:hypothetical protein